MSAAISAKTPAQRANIAAQIIRRGNTSGRELSNCFMMGDGDAVLAYLVAKAVTDPRIADYARRAQWGVAVGNDVRQPF